MEEIRDRCRCALSYSALDDSLRSLREKISKGEIIPSEVWFKVIRDNISRVEKYCLVTLPEVWNDVKDAEEDLKRGNLQSALASVEAARTGLAIKFLKCEMSKT